MKIEGPFIVDTNILIYALNIESRFYGFSRGILRDNSGNIFLAHKSITEFIAVMSKIGRYDIIENELDTLYGRFNIVYSDESSAGILRDLVLRYRPSGNRVYDFEIISVMLNIGISRIATVNVSDFSGIDEIQIIRE
jgi:predicted nucleic acid-binding protein